MNPKMILSMLNASLLKVLKGNRDAKYTLNKNELPDGMWFCGTIRISHPKDKDKLINIDIVNRAHTIEVIFEERFLAE